MPLVKRQQGRGKRRDFSAAPGRARQSRCRKPLGGGPRARRSGGSGAGARRGSGPRDGAARARSHHDGADPHRRCRERRGDIAVSALAGRRAPGCRDRSPAGVADGYRAVHGAAVQRQRFRCAPARDRTGAQHEGFRSHPPAMRLDRARAAPQCLRRGDRCADRSWNAGGASGAGKVCGAFCRNAVSAVRDFGGDRRISGAES